MIAEIRGLDRNTFFDEKPCTEISTEAIDFDAASEFFSAVSRQIAPSSRKSFGLLVNSKIAGSK